MWLIQLRYLYYYKLITKYLVFVSFGLSNIFAPVIREKHICNQYFLFQMIFAAISRCLLQINSCLNPFVYATTIPAFRKIVDWMIKNPCRCKDFGKTKTEVMRNAVSQTTQFQSPRLNNRVNIAESKL